MAAPNDIGEAVMRFERAFDGCVPNGPARWLLVDAYNTMIAAQLGIRKGKRMNGAKFGQERKDQGPPWITTREEAKAELDSIIADCNLS